MAYPFGGHTQFQEYLDWCCSQGCKLTYGYSKFTGHMKTMILIDNPGNGKHHMELGIDPKEYLTRSLIAHMDRRLGLNSPFRD